MLQTIRTNKQLQGLLLIAPILILLTALLVIPLFLVVVASFGSRAPDGGVVYTFTLDNYIRLIGLNPQALANDPAYLPTLLQTCLSGQPCAFDVLYYQVLGRSLTLAFQTTVLVILIGYPIAYFVSRAPDRQKNLLLFLILVPLWTNFVIRMYAWLMILRTQGVLNSVLGWGAGLVGLSFEPLQLYPSEIAVLIGMVYEFLPFMILPMYTSLEKIDSSLFEAAADLGANTFWTFVRVTLPLSLPGMVAGTILVFIPVMGTFIVSDILGGRNVVLIGNLIQRQFLDARDPAFGSAASLILMVMTLLITLFYTRKFGFGDEIASA